MFAVGEIVRLGNGKVMHKVRAVITTGRTTTYDLIAVNGGRKGQTHVGVPEQKLNRFFS
jgi:hypothetical protein